jgi:long-chain acyl-CoA synthetase
MIYEHAAKRPNDLALDDLTRRRTWAQLADRTTRIARFLREQVGLGVDDHVAVLMDNRVELVELSLGAILAGVWLTPINWHLSDEEIAYIVGDSGSRLLFSDARFEEIARGSGASTVMLAGEELDGVLAGASDRPMDPEGPMGGNMIYTSGATGRPKGVKRARAATLGQGVATIRKAATTFGLDGRGSHLVTGPLYHAAPLLFAVYDQVNGASMVIMPSWDETQTLDLIQEREITHTHLVPTMFVRLLRLPEEVRESFDAPRLELVLHGAAPVAVPAKRRMIEWWGEKIVEYWGGTEAGMNTMADSADWLAHPGTVGKALPAFEVFAVDDDGRRLPAGEIGDLYCRHKHMTEVFEYHGDPERTREAYLEPGVFTLGDIGRVDEGGYVYLADRRSNMIISGGVNIYPAEIEQVLQEHPAVGDVAVFGIPDEEWGESIKAAVELLGGREPSPELEAEILDFGRQHLARYKVPRSVDFEAELPRHLNGKLYVRRLRDRYWKDRASKI